MVREEHRAVSADFLALQTPWLNRLLDSVVMVLAKPRPVERDRHVTTKKTLFNDVFNLGRLHPNPQQPVS